MKFIKKPIEIEATQWFTIADHPKVTAFFNSNIKDEHVCSHCQMSMHRHGWIQTLEGGHIVCPGDWIITGIAGEFYPCKPKIFEQSYEESCF